MPAHFSELIFIWQSNMCSTDNRTNGSSTLHARLAQTTIPIAIYSGVRPLKTSIFSKAKSQYSTSSRLAFYRVFLRGWRYTETSFDLDGFSSS
jgi:hypothetical protein